MKKNKIHIAFSIFLLALMLAGRVGIHIFHHHESSANPELAAFKKAHQGTPVLTAEQESHADCALCNIDAFQEIAIEAFGAFIFLLIFRKPLYEFLYSHSRSFLFFTEGRGPPVFVRIA